MILHIRSFISDWSIMSLLLACKSRCANLFLGNSLNKHPINYKFLWKMPCVFWWWTTSSMTFRNSERKLCLSFHNFTRIINISSIRWLLPYCPESIQLLQLSLMPLPLLLEGIFNLKILMLLMSNIWSAYSPLALLIIVRESSLIICIRWLQGFKSLSLLYQMELPY